MTKFGVTFILGGG